MRYVVPPRVARDVLPDLVPNTLEVSKLTSIARLVALPELSCQAWRTQSVICNPNAIVPAARGCFVLRLPAVRLPNRRATGATGGRR